MLASCARSALPRVLRTSRCTRWPLQTPLRPPLPRAAAAAEQLVLGIESSCDDTAAAVVSSSGCVLGEAIASQEDVHKAWGGVVPSLAMEAHAAAIDGVVAAALGQAGVALGDLDAVAVTIGPGLSMCLKVGVEKARALAHEGHVPVVPCHHMEAHALVARLGAERDVPFPFLCLLVSGGHNLLLLARGVGDYVQIGTTVDDAIGEAYDKIARMLGLELTPSGGPALEALAHAGDPHAYNFTIPLIGKPTCNFSYSGLKAAARLAVEADLGEDLGPGTLQVRANIAASFQRVAVAQLVHRVKRGVEWAREIEPGVTCMVVSGGVAANTVVRSTLEETAAAAGLPVHFPPLKLCTDNGVMVAWAGHERLRLGLSAPPPATAEPAEGEWVDVRPRWPLTSELHPRCHLDKPKRKKRRLLPKPSRRPHESLTDVTRRQLAGEDRATALVRPEGSWAEAEAEAVAA